MEWCPTERRRRRRRKKINTSKLVHAGSNNRNEREKGINNMKWFDSE